MDTTAGSYFERLNARISLRLGDDAEMAAISNFAEWFWRHAPENED